MAFRIDSFRECIDTWTRLNEEGAKVIASVNRNNPEKAAESLRHVVDSLKQVLEKMYALYDASALATPVHEAMSLPSVALQLRACVEMFDQEYMVKESIFSILSKPNYFTRQHLNGSSAIWATEPYIDRSRVNALFTNKND